MKRLEAEVRKRAYEILKRSVYLLHVDSGSCNGCDIEVLDVLAPYFDAERFGVKLVASPKHADALLVTGPVTRQFLQFLKRVYDYLPKPTVVIACGACACGGGIWYDSYNIIGGVDKVIPVDVYIPGCPPRPSAILHGTLVALGVLESRMKKVEHTVRDEEFKPLRIEKGYIGLNYDLYKKMLIELKRMLGYRLAYKVLRDYMKVLLESKSPEEVEEGCREIIRKWGGDPRIIEAVGKINEVVKKHVETKTV